MLPPTVCLEYYQLVFRFYDGQGIPNMDRNSSDAYICTNYLDFNAKTKIITTKNNCVTWNEEMWLAVRKPALGGKVSFNVFDSDIITDDYIGTMEFSLKYINDKITKFTRWINMYGSTPGSNNKFYKRLYDQNPDLASSWNGRILVQLEKIETKNPKQKCIPVTNFADEEVISSRRMKKYYVNLHIGQGICLPSECPNLEVEVKIAEYSFKTDKKPFCEGRSYDWSWKIQENTAINLPYNSTQDMADVFIYIRNGTKYLSFKRMRPRNYTEGKDWEWINMDQNLCDTGLNNTNDCGIISWKFSISDKPLEVKTAEKKPKKVKTYFYNIYVHILQCRDLPAADACGTSDTYINLVTASKVVRKTEIAYGTLIPVYSLIT